MTTRTFNTPVTTPIEPIGLVADIIQTEMDLEAGRVAYAYQNYQIPKDGLFVIVGYLGPSTQIANQAYFDDTLNNEVQESVFQHTIQIEIMSLAPDNSARIRKEEIALALRSFYSQQQQDANLMSIAWLQGDFIDGNYAELSAMYQRYITTAIVTALHRKVKTSGYFDNFPIELTSEGARQNESEINAGENPFAQ